MPRMTDNSTSYMPTSLTATQYAVPTNDDGSRMEFKVSEKHSLTELLRDICLCGREQRLSRGQRMEAEWLAGRRRAERARRAQSARTIQGAPRVRFRPVNRPLANNLDNDTSATRRLSIVPEEVGSSAATQSEGVSANEAVRRHWGDSTRPIKLKTDSKTPHVSGVAINMANAETPGTRPEQDGEETSNLAITPADEQGYDLRTPEPDRASKKKGRRARFRSSISHAPGSIRRSERRPEETRGEHMRRVGPHGVFQTTVHTTATTIRSWLVGDPMQNHGELQGSTMIPMRPLSGAGTPHTPGTPWGGATPKSSGTPWGGASPQSPGSPWEGGDEIFGANKPLSRVPTQELSQKGGGDMRS